MGAQITKRCHWVPQSYLRAFAADCSRQKIWRLGKTAGKPELKPISKVAVKFHLYAPKGADGNRNDAIEKKLADLEQFISGPIWNSVCNGFPDFTWEPLRKMIALLVATTYVRTPLQFELWKSFQRSMVQLCRQPDGPPAQVTIGGRTHEIDHSDWPAFRDASEEDMKAAWNDFVGTAGGIAPQLLRMRWAVLFSEQPVFVTSDNPVLITHPSLKFRGLNDPDALVSFPLSPRRILMLDNRRSEPDGRFYPLNNDPGAVNGLTWRNAIDHMFSPRDPDRVCEEICAEAARAGFG